MAGAGYKLFNTGDVLTAAQVNTYLQEQAVMRFANAAARTTALSGVLAEGMMSYLDDTNSVEVYNGSAWVSVSSDQTPLTTKGDLFTYSTTDARLPVGNNGETLVADSSATTGLRWQGNFAAGKNKIINGDFGIWQRGTSFSSATGYTADRWTANASYPTTISQQSFTPGNTITGYESPFFIRLVSVSSQLPLIQHKIEDVRTFAGQTVTLSFWAKADASTTFTTYFDQNFGSGGSATVGNLGIYAPTLTTSWVRYSTTFTLNSISGKTVGTSSFLMLTMYGTANRTVDIWGVQLEAGSVATAFQTATGTLAGELAACQRYYWRAANVSNSTYDTLGLGGIGFSTTKVFYATPSPVPMRITPTSMDYSTTYSDYINTDYVNETAVTALGLDTGASSPTVMIFAADSASGLTQFRPYVLRTKSSGTPNTYLGFSAEL